MKSIFTTKKSVVTIFFFSLIGTLFLTGCFKDGSVKLGAPIPANAEVVKLSDIIAAPRDYNGKTIVIKGIISGQCPSLCEFFFKDGAHKVTIFPQGFKFPKLPQGKPVTVLANITSGNDNIVFSALGIQL